MPDYSQKQMDFVMKHYREGKMDTLKAMQRFMDKTHLEPETSTRKTAVRWAWTLSAVAAAVLAGVIFWHTYSAATVVLEAGDLMAEFVLPDHSQVTLDQGSALVYRKHGFGKERRDVELSGRAFFEVAKDPYHPFEISAGNGFVRVLGTEFQVDAREKDTQVQVLSGKVFVASRSEVASAAETSHPASGVVLTDGMKAIVEDSSDQSVIVQDGDGNGFAWYTRQFVFENTPVEDVLKTLSDFYGVELSTAPTDKRLTGEFDVDQLEKLVELIEMALDIEILY